MTNKEWLATLSPEEWWNIVHEWLFNIYGKQWTDSRMAILMWLSEEHCLVDRHLAPYMSNYCQMCGAKMDEEVKQDD